MQRGAFAIGLCVMIGGLGGALMFAAGRSAPDAGSPDLEAAGPTAPTPQPADLTGSGAPEPIPPFWKLERAASAGEATAPRLIVQLVDPRGQLFPRAGIVLGVARFARSDDRAPTATLGEVRSDADGRAEVTTLSPDLADLFPETRTAVLEIRPRGGDIYIPLGRADSNAQRLPLHPLIAALREASPGDRIVVPVTVRDVRPIVARVVDDDGRPMHRVKVRAIPPERFLPPVEVESDEEGLVAFRYRGAQPLSEPPDEDDEGPDRLTLSRPDLHGELRLADAFLHRPDPRGVRALLDQARKTRVNSTGVDAIRRVLGQQGIADDRPRLVVDPTRELDLECVDSAGRPIADAELGLVADGVKGSKLLRIRTDGSGKVWIRIPRTTRIVTVRADPTAFLDGRADLPDGRRSARVVMHRLVEVRVHLRSNTGPTPAIDSLQWTLELDDRDVPLDTKHFRDVGKGGWAVRVPGIPTVLRAATANGELSGDVSLRGVSNERVWLMLGALKASHTITFWLLDEKRKPVAESRVLIRAIGEGRRRQLRKSVRTDRVGQCVVRLAEGTYRYIMFFWQTAEGEQRFTEVKGFRVRRAVRLPVLYRPPGAGGK